MKCYLNYKKAFITDFSKDQYDLIVRKMTINKKGVFGEIAHSWTPFSFGTYKGKSSLIVPRFHPILETLNFSLKEKDLFFNEERHINISINVKPRDEIQEDIADFLFGKGKYENLSSKPRRALFANTGSGKTFSTLNYIANHNSFAAIICPDKKAIMTWRDEVLKFTDIKEDEIGIIEGSAKFKALKEKSDKYKIVLFSSKTLSSLFIKMEDKLVNEVFNTCKFGLLVHDEAHLNIFVLNRLELCSDIKKTFYLTATPSRSVYNENKLLQFILPNKNCTYIEEVKPRFHLFNVFYESGAEGNDKKGIQLPGGFQFPVYSKKILLNEKYFNKFKENVLYVLLKEGLKNLSHKESKIAIACKTKEECKAIYNFLVNEKKPKVGIGIFTSDIEDMDERFKETNNRIIITTDKSLNGIVNISNLEAIILIHPIRSEPMLLQVCGRIRNEPIKCSDGSLVKKKASIYCLYDTSFNKLNNFATSVRKTLSKQLINYENVHLENKGLE